MAKYLDKNGYEREHSNAIHRNRAYNGIYMRDRKKYSLPFSRYEVHHIDGNKRNNKISNLAILLPEIHDEIHEISKEFIDNWGMDWNSACLEAWDLYSDGMTVKDIKNQLKKVIGQREEIENKRKDEERKRRNKREEVERIRREEEKRKRKKRRKIKIILFSLIFLVVFLFIFVKVKNLSDEKEVHSGINPVYSGIKKIETVEDLVGETEPYEVRGTKTEVIIRNNEQNPISLKVTYWVHSPWFGKDDTYTKVFEVASKSEETFKVYSNDGCTTHPCYVDIIDSNLI